MIHTIIVEIFSAVCPWLALVLCLQFGAVYGGVKARGARQLLWLGLIALGVLAAPIQGIPIARWIASINANFSLPFTGLLAVAVWERAFARKIFSARDWRASWMFGAVSGLVLYPLALGFGKFDAYEWGWGFSPLFAGIAVLTGLLFWKQNRFGVPLLLAVIAYHLQLLESTNYWDYLVDPVYCLLSILALSYLLVRLCCWREQPTQR
jgi:predicted membrane protein